MINIMKLYELSVLIAASVSQLSGKNFFTDCFEVFVAAELANCLISKTTQFKVKSFITVLLFSEL